VQLGEDALEVSLHCALLYVDLRADLAITPALGYQSQHLGPLATVLSVAAPVAVYIGLNYTIYYYLARRFYRLDAWLLTAIAVVLVASVVAAQSGIDVAKCLVILILAPAIIVVGYEGRGYRYEAEALGAKAI
jgi:hypothetical protein